MPVLSLTIRCSPSNVSHVRGIDESAQSTIFTSSRTSAPGQSRLNLRSTVRSTTESFSKSPIFTASWLSTDEPPQLIHHLQSASFLETLSHFHTTVTSHLLVRHELECVDESVAYSMWRSERSEDLCFTAVRGIQCDQDSVRIPAVVLAVTCSTPPVALLLPVLCGSAPDVVFKAAISVAAHVRRRDSSVPSDWHDDPLQEDRASVHDLLYTALPLIVLLPYLVALQ